MRQIYGSDVRLELPLRQEDLDWAKRPRLGVCGLLVPGDEEGTWRAAAPLVEDTTRCPDSPPLTLSVWEAVAWMTKLYRLPDRHRVFCRALRTVQHWAETGEDFTVLADARLRDVVTTGARIANEAITLMFDTGGSNAARSDSTLLRYYRDASMFRTHIAAQYDAVWLSTGRVWFGGELSH